MQCLFYFFPRSVSYSDLSKEEKEQVLADLLVKSAINQALEKQKEVRCCECNKTLKITKCPMHSEQPLLSLQSK